MYIEMAPVHNNLDKWKCWAIKIHVLLRRKIVA